MTPATAALALRPLIHSLRWAPVLGAGLVGAALVWNLAPERPAPASSLAGLRLAAVVLCAGAAFGLDDRAGDTVAPSPTSLLVRRALRLAVVVVAAGLVWTALTATAVVAAPDGHGPLPWVGVTLEAAALLAFTLATSVVAGRWAPQGLGGVAGGPALTLALLGAYLGQMRWPRQLTLFPLTPDDPAWVTAHRRWAVVLAVALAVLVVESLDPARRRLMSRRG